MSEGERRLAAIMFTDIVGYTALTQRDESLALALLEKHRELIRPIIRKHKGREVKTIGDAFLVEFDSALEATNCAQEIQRVLREYNAKATNKVLVRIGIHVGDVVHRDGDVYGDAVNIASRIVHLAGGGEVCISEQVYDQVGNKVDAKFEKLETRALKNVNQQIEAYRLVMPWERGYPEGEPELDRQRVAVLPFVSLSPDPNDEYFSDGLTEELITKISEIQGLKVISRTSAMNYKHKEKKSSEIGRELATGSIIEGSVRKAGNRIRVTVQLVDTRSDEHLWASTYDRDLDDIFAIQTDIASRVAGALAAGVFSKGERKDTEDIEAYTTYMRAAQLLHEGTDQNLVEAIVLLEKVVKRDPRFVRAYTNLALARVRLAAGSGEFAVETEKAEIAARRALEVGPEYAEAHAAMARVHANLDRFEEVISEAEKAVEINPSLADAQTSLGIGLTAIGTQDGALEAFRRAYELDPLSFLAGQQLGLALVGAGKKREALLVLEKTKELNPRNPRAYARLAEVYMLDGDFARAQELLSTARGLDPNDNQVKSSQGVLFALAGKKKEAEDTLREIMSSENESSRLWGQLFIQSALGNLDEAFKALMRMTETHSWPAPIGTWPSFEEMRKDRRFAEFRAKVGLPP